MNKKNKNLMIIGMIIIIIIVFVAIGMGMIFNEKAKFMGTWQYSEGGTITFKNDDSAVIDRQIIGPFIFTNLIGNINYKIANQQVTFTAGSVSISFYYNFIAQNTLVLTNNGELSITLYKI